MTQNEQTQTIRTVCRECMMSCGMRVQVTGGRAVKLEDDPSSPKTRDKLCWRAQAALERLYHPDRLHVPLKRVGEKGEDKWEEISWDEALDSIAEKLGGLKARFGAESVALVKGHYDRRCGLYRKQAGPDPVDRHPE